MVDHAPSASDPSDLVIQILDVGQGDGIYIEFPMGKDRVQRNMLVDLGSTKNKKITAADIFGYFETHTRFKQPGQRLDWLILTHGDSDHYNLVEEFLTGLKVKLGNVVFGGESVHYRRTFMAFLTRYAEKVSGAPSQFPHSIANDFGGAEVRILGANAVVGDYGAWGKNSASVVLQIRYGGNGILLTGDATIDSENAIMNRLVAHEWNTAKHKAILAAELRSTVLKVAHHGSARTSTQPRWVEAVRPEYVFISSDRSGALGDGETSTGHRLPQSLCLEIIRNHTTLADDTEKHPVVSSYDPKDFADYRWDKATYPKGVPDPVKGTRKWLQIETTRGIFCTLAMMDSNEPNPNGSDAVPTDLGAQYEIRLREDGSMVISTTLDNGRRGTLKR